MPVKLKKTQSSKKSKGKSNEEVAILKASLARALADYDNLSKRVERDQEAQGEAAKNRVVGRILPIYDMLLEAQKNLGDGGIALIIGELENALRDLGVEKIKVEVGDDFDAHLHEAIEGVEGSDKEKIAEVVSAGWIASSGKIIRHTKVKVFS